MNLDQAWACLNADLTREKTCKQVFLVAQAPATADPGLPRLQLIQGEGACLCCSPRVFPAQRCLGLPVQAGSII